ncbi:hypothetical protein AMTR_s00190p00031580 [Amborella trichopoda]|uniref:Uncharacterized protein n=1 Tax=Amborella trichopoda TaxID=13333 RepID=U5D7K3_AMBTC|nr:hypothetical protein AMTR_s00190p00031580 [Amborella trichopoda]
MLKLITKGKGKGKKVQRESDAEEIGREYESPIDEEDDQETDFDAHMERARIASIQDLNYRQMEIQEMYGRRDSASSSRQPQEHIVPGRGGYGPSLLRSIFSRLRHNFSSHPSSYSRPSTTQRYEPIDVSSMTREPFGLDPYKSQYHKKKLKFPSVGVLIEKARKLISMFWYANALSFNYVRSDFYPQMVTSIAEACPGVRGPTIKELVGPCLEVVVHDVDKHIA